MTSLIPPFLRRWLQARREAKEQRTIAEVKRRLREWANEVEIDSMEVTDAMVISAMNSMSSIPPAAPALNEWHLVEADVQVIQGNDKIAPVGFILTEADASAIKRK